MRIKIFVESNNWDIHNPKSVGYGPEYQVDVFIGDIRQIYKINSPTDLKDLLLVVSSGKADIEIIECEI